MSVTPKSAINKEIGSRSKLVIILTLSLLSSFLSIFPILSAGLKGVFYSFEPDIVYVSNAIFYNYTGLIRYIDHPGTVVIRLISLTIYPIRFYTKFFTEYDFITWTIYNQSVFYLYLRIFQSLILALAVVVYLLAIYKATKSLIVIVFAWLGLYMFKEFPIFLGATIAPEAVNFLVIAIWLYVFASFIHKPIRLWGYALVVLSSLALACKFTSLFYLPMTMIVLYPKKNRLTENLIHNVILVTVLYFVVFIISTWPIRDQYLGMLGWIFKLVSHTNIHGNGSTSLFNINTYSQSLYSLYNLETSAVYLIFGTIATMLFLGTRGIEQKDRYVYAIFVVALLGSFVFAKFPLAHYQLPNYATLVFVASYIFSKLTFYLRVGIVILILLVLPANIRWYLDNINREISNIVNLENYLIANPSSKATVWEWARAKDYTILHSRDWIGHIYAQKLQTAMPNSYSLDYSNLDTAIAPNGTRIKLEDLCWDKLYIQEASLPALRNKNPYISQYNARPIPNTTNKMWVIENDACKSFGQ